MGESWNKSFHRRAMGDMIINSTDIITFICMYFLYFLFILSSCWIIIFYSSVQLWSGRPSQYSYYHFSKKKKKILTIRSLHFVHTWIPACDHIVILLTLLLITCQRERESFVCVLKCWIYWTQLYLTKTIEDNEWKQWKL